MKSLLLMVFALSTGGVVGRADVTPDSLFSDHAVVQRDRPLPVWGTAADGEKITVEMDGQSASTVAQGGHWKVALPPHAAGGPYDLSIHGTNTVILKDLLCGDVWVASGQSNMERQLGPRPPQPPIDDWRQEVAAADYPQIREYYVPEVLSTTPVADVHGHWTVCTPQTAGSFTAVGYFFARDLQKAVHVPVGILFSAWGGTVAEAWTSAAALAKLPDFAAAAHRMEAMAAQTPTPTPVSASSPPPRPAPVADAAWAALDFDASAWKTAPGDVYHEDAPQAFLGVIWTRRELDLPPAWAGREATLHLGQVDDNDTTFVNGVPVGGTDGWQATRNYKVPAQVLRAGRNVVAVRIVNVRGGGGMIPPASTPFTLEMTGTDAAPAVPLAGNWRFQTGTALGQLPSAAPARRGMSPNTPTVLFNGMIAPLLPFPIKGVVWYQGESNSDRGEQYRTLFPTMIADWRQRWGSGDFPFLFVQVAPYQGTKPEIREAQFLTLQTAPNTAMAVLSDLGEAENIHPPHKAPVGARLALAARALAYGEHMEYSGPLYESMQAGSGRISLHFTHAGGGLTAKDGPLRGFTIAGADGQFVPAQAEIQGDAVVVSAAQVPEPTAVRYGWANVPDGNLFNGEGLPASPFRTDVPALGASSAGAR